MNQAQRQDPLAQASALMKAGKDADAVEILRKALQRRPSDIGMLLLLARAHTRAGQLDQGAFVVDRLRTLKVSGKDLVETLDALGRIELARKRYDKVIAAYEELLRVDPRVPLAYEPLAGAYLHTDDYAAATRTFERGIAACPTDTNVWHLFVLMHIMHGQSAKAIEIARRGVAAIPDHPDLRADICHVLNYVPDVPMAEVAAAHKEFGRVAMSYIKTIPPPYTNTPEPDRKLRIGFVSGDFKTHSCAYFFEPLLDNLDRAGFEPIMYHRDERYDETTKRLASKAQLKHVDKVPYKDLAQLLRADSIDIAIDLSGHMAGNGLYALIRKPAPMQATWLGYPNTTGLPTIDYRIIDALTDPPRDASAAARVGLPSDWEGADAFAHESLVRLSRCFLCYRPPELAPPVEPPPSQKFGRPITFASFNAVQKVNPRLIKLWAGAMRAVPDARLLLKGGYRVSATTNMCRELFAAQGVDPSRIEFRTMTQGPREHFETYHQADIALDAFPYHGTTTTCEAMHMGVPVISRIGASHASRVGLSLLSAVGLPELACGTDEAFAQATAALASDPSRLASLRSTMRERLARSPLGDGPGFARAFEVALRQMWQRWCERGAQSPAGSA